jgi:hypothetical protein
MVEVLPLKADWILEPCLARGFSDDLLRLAPSPVLRLPGNITLFIGYFLRRAQMVAVIKTNLVEGIRLKDLCPQGIIL